jgi:hypothetical protein
LNCSYYLFGGQALSFYSLRKAANSLTRKSHLRQSYS